jgi:hypothetical protein
MIIRQVMTPRSRFLDLSCLPWVVCCEPKRTLDGRTVKAVGFEVFRGQSSNTETKPGIPRVGVDPFEIRLIPGKAISTSTTLTPHIREFAAPPGRMYLINVVPGVEYVSLREAVRKMGTIAKEDFDFLQKELPAGHAYKDLSLQALWSVFFKLLITENEVLLKPSSGVFHAESGPETWDREEAFVYVTMATTPPETVRVYETGFYPNSAVGRGRTFRRKPRRKNKNGHRPTRKSSHDDRRNRHTRNRRYSDH